MTEKVRSTEKSTGLIQKQIMNNELKTLLQVIPSGIIKYAADDAEKFEYVNYNLINDLGYTEEAFREKFHNSFKYLVCEEDRERVKHEIISQEGNGGIGRFDFRIEAADGKLRWYHDEGVKVADSEGKEWYYVTLVDITRRIEAQEKLRQSEEMNRLAIEHSGNIITRFDVKDRTLTLPVLLSPIFSLPRVLHNMPQEQIELGRISPQTAHIYAGMFEDIVNGSAAGTATYQQNSTVGWRWLNAQYTTIFTSNGEPASAVISFTDVSEKLEKELVYNKWNQSLKERSDETFTLFRCNLSRNCSYDSREGNLLKIEFSDRGISFDEMTREYTESYVYEEDKESYLSFLNADTLLAGYYRGHTSGTFEYRESNNEQAYCWRRLSVELVEYPNSNEVEAYLMFEDIDEQKKTELLTLERSETDSLTGVYNRAAFLKRMEKIIHSSKAKHAFLMLDVDNFKNINDTYGHGTGDIVLKELVKRLRTIFRTNDLICRLGGDEFAIFMNNIPYRESAESKAKQICELEIILKDINLLVTVSMGVALIPQDGRDFESLYKKADDALYVTKKSGKRGYRFSK